MAFVRTNRQIVKNGAITTTALAGNGGILNPEQSRKFLVQAMEQTTLGNLVRHEIRSTTAGEIDKIGIGRRLLRKKVENSDDGYRAGVEHSKLEYQCTPVRVPWEITEETLRQNIQGQSYEALVTQLMTAAVGLDMEDICLNGDTAVSAEDEDHDFLYVNDGWIKQLEAGSNVVDHANANMTLDVFYGGLRSLPNKYNNGKLRWVMSPHRRQEWERYILTQAVTQGGIVTDRRVENPAAIPAIECANMPDDKIILTDPKNLIVVNSYNTIIRSTNVGKTAIMEDKKFYVIHMDFDAIIEELDAAVIIKNLKAIA